MRTHALRCLGPHGFHRVTYYEWGDVANPRVVLCAHGLTRNGRDFDILARALAPRFRVVCPDMPGRGMSQWLNQKQDYGYPVYLADMVALIARTGADEVDCVGTSMGGLIGMMLAAQSQTPIRRLLLNDVGPFIPRAALERLAMYVGKAPRFATLDELERYLRVVMVPYGTLTDQQWRHLAQHSSRQSDDGGLVMSYDPAIANAFAGPLQDVSLWPVWDAIRCPTLVVRGKESDLLLRKTADEMTRRGPKAQLVEFAGIGHAPALMADDQIAVVREFLDSPDS
jgi:pimeloyl-ACP methyl ester carboxylesterase